MCVCVYAPAFVVYVLDEYTHTRQYDFTANHSILFRIHI